MKLRNIKDEYQIVVIDCPYDTWESEKTRELFGKILQLKFKGYLVSYPYGTLPVDTSDFIGTHHALCRTINNQLEPVMVYKTVTLARCQLHNLPLPVLSLMNAIQASSHAKEILRITAEASKQQHEISYDSSWTMDPEIRRDKAKSEFLKDIFVSMYVNYHLDYQIQEILGLGLLRFKTDQLFKSIGFQFVGHLEQPLPSVSIASLQFEPVVLLHLKSFSEIAMQKAKQFQHLWKNRIEISNPDAIHQMGISKKVA